MGSDFGLWILLISVMLCRHDIINLFQPERIKAGPRTIFQPGASLCGLYRL